MTLPALLVPQVRAGEQLRYRTLTGSQRESLSIYTVSSVSPSSISWVGPGEPNESKDGASRFTLTSDGVVVNNNNGRPTGAYTFAYNAAQFGKPPQILDVGAHWSNTVYEADWMDFWSVNVADVQPKRGLVRLHLTLVRRQPSALVSYYERQDGDITFVNGIMTSFGLSGYLTTTFAETAPYHEDISFFPEPRESYRISRQTMLVGTVP